MSQLYCLDMIQVEGPTFTVSSLMAHLCEALQEAELMALFFT